VDTAGSTISELPEEMCLAWFKKVVHGVKKEEIEGVQVLASGGSNSWKRRKLSEFLRFTRGGLPQFASPIVLSRLAFYPRFLCEGCPDFQCATEGGPCLLYGLFVLCPVFPPSQLHDLRDWASC
jgi:hypothetical protein